MRAKLIRFLCPFFLLVPGAVHAEGLTLAIKKIDPLSPAANADFSVVVLVTNPTSAAVTITLICETDSTSGNNLSVAPGASDGVTLTGKFGAAGTHSVSVLAYPAQSASNGGPLPWPVLRREKPLADASQSVSILSLPVENAVCVGVGPNQPGLESNGVSSSGVVQQLAGGPDALFLVSKTAGLWRSTEQVRWIKLGGPRRAFSIAEDPTASSHLIVGERSDDVADERLGMSGVWGSVDQGTTWTYLYDPVVDTGSQAVPAVAFSHQTGVLFMATRRGVARWEPPQNVSTTSNITFPATASGNITALAVDHARIWARTSQAILHSDDDGKTWLSETLPTRLALPETGVLDATYDETGNGGNDRNTLAAFDDEAYVVFKPDTSGLSDALKAYKNLSPLLIYRPDNPPATRWTAQWTRDGDGRGLGGTRLVRAYHLPCPTLPDVIGKRRQLFYDAGQGVQQALSETNGTLTFDSPQTAGHVNVHCDWWDFMLAPPTCAMAGQEAWLSTDGGVFKTKLGSNGRLAGAHWASFNEGLNTHNVDGLIAISQGGNKPTLLAYPTPDNGAWFRDKKNVWQSQGFMGDANFVAGDGVSPLALIWRQLWDGGRNDVGVITGFGNSFPGSDGSDVKKFELYRTTFAAGLDGPARVQPITPGALESVASSALDVALIIQAPLPGSDGKSITGRDSINNVWPQPSPPQPILIRNPQFTEHPVLRPASSRIGTSFPHCRRAPRGSGPAAG